VAKPVTGGPIDSLNQQSGSPGMSEPREGKAIGLESSDGLDRGQEFRGKSPLSGKLNGLASREQASLGEAWVSKCVEIEGRLEAAMWTHFLGGVPRERSPWMWSSLVCGQHPRFRNCVSKTVEAQGFPTNRKHSLGQR
jgi:hypothetical protein